MVWRNHHNIFQTSTFFMMRRAIHWFDESMIIDGGILKQFFCLFHEHVQQLKWFSLTVRIYFFPSPFVAGGGITVRINISKNFLCALPYRQLMNPIFSVFICYGHEGNGDWIHLEHHHRWLSQKSHSVLVNRLPTNQFSHAVRYKDFKLKKGVSPNIKW